MKQRKAVFDENLNAQLQLNENQIWEHSLRWVSHQREQSEELDWINQKVKLIKELDSRSKS
jgi:hypothetical protein